MEYQTANLYKLAKVWGFVKYSHLAFLTGARCWDAELLYILPVVRYANPSYVNDILYHWFVGLGDSGWHGNRSVYMLRSMGTEVLPYFNMNGYEYAWDAVAEAVESANELELVNIIPSWQRQPSTITLRVCESYLDAFDGLWLRNAITLTEPYALPLADLTWLTDAAFIGQDLAAAFGRFTEAPMVDRSRAPFDIVGNGWVMSNDFSAQNTHQNMNFSDPNYRLLGLFRLWNAMVYFYPHINNIGYDWDELLRMYIPRMLEGDDSLSYQLTLMTLSTRLQDGRMTFSNEHLVRDSRFGGYVAPLRLAGVNGELVVVEQMLVEHRDYATLLAGDVILAVNGVDISTIIEEYLRYAPSPREEMALEYLAVWHMILRQHSQENPMTLRILRRDEEMTVEIDTVARAYIVDEIFERPFRSVELSSRTHIIRHDNIGVIRPSAFRLRGTMPRIMAELADTYGIIVDFRHPRYWVAAEMSGFLLGEPQLYSRLTEPSLAVPGVFLDIMKRYAGHSDFADFFYENPVVVLMDIRTFGEAETATMILRNAPNVTVIGTSSMGSNGDLAVLPLPGGFNFYFTGRGVLTPEGEHTHFIGLEPDVVVERSLSGIRSRRDEIMDAAVAYILEAH